MEASFHPCTTILACTKVATWIPECHRKEESWPLMQRTVRFSESFLKIKLNDFLDTLILQIHFFDKQKHW